MLEEFNIGTSVNRINCQVPGQHCWAELVHPESAWPSALYQPIYGRPSWRTKDFSLSDLAGQVQFEQTEIYANYSKYSHNQLFHTLMFNIEDFHTKIVLILKKIPPIFLKKLAISIALATCIIRNDFVYIKCQKEEE